MPTIASITKSCLLEMFHSRFGGIPLQQFAENDQAARDRGESLYGYSNNLMMPTHILARQRLPDASIDGQEAPIVALTLIRSLACCRWGKSNTKRSTDIPNNWTGTGDSSQAACDLRRNKVITMFKPWQAWKSFQTMFRSRIWSEEQAL